jgi:hypothetical protein
MGGQTEGRMAKPKIWKGGKRKGEIVWEVGGRRGAYSKSMSMNVWNILYASFSSTTAK